MSKEEFVALAAARYDELQALSRLDNFYDYEKQFVGIWRDLGRQVLEKNMGDPVGDHRKKKKITTPLGKVSLNNVHPFSQSPFGFRLSSLLQELMVYAGTLDCYGKSREVLSKFISVEGSDVQVWRVGEAYGKAVAAQDREDPPARSLKPLSLSDTRCTWKRTVR